MNCPNCGVENSKGFKFCGNCGHKLSEVSTSQEPLSLRDERRDVAILFADVKGFTAMCEHLDPEKVHDIMNECFEGLGHAIKSFEGYVDKYIGDNIMALFGAPIAHEDDPARACRAAIAMQSFLSKFSKKLQSTTTTPLQMRIGINCGLVVTGGMGSEDVKRDYTAMGDAVNLASRLESSALPEHILVSAEIMKRTRGQFKFGPVQHLKVKGKEHLVEAYDLIEEISEIDPRGRSGLSVRLIGRKSELKELFHQLRTINQSNNLIEIRGEMGIGKTRLLEETLKQLPQKKCLTVNAVPLLRQRNFGLLQRILNKMIYELHPQIPETLEELSRILKSLGNDLEIFIPALWFFLAPPSLQGLPPDPDPKTLRNIIEQGVLLFLRNFSQHYSNFLLFIDSYEWADTESSILLENLKASEGLPIPLVIASRSDGRAPLQPEKTIYLKGLKDQDAKELLETLLRGAQLPESIKEDILKRANGIPLHIEEIVRSLVDQKIINQSSEGSPWIFNLTMISQDILLPSSIRSAMTSRLDQLNPFERDFLNQCSIQGTDFDLEVLEILRKNPVRRGPAIQTLTPELERRNFIANDPQTPVYKLKFCHPLMQETCYQTQLQRDRQILHYETALALCELSGSEISAPQDLLSYHFENAQKWAEAARANLHCAHKARDVFLNEEAIQRYERTIKQIQSLESSDKNQRNLSAQAFENMARIYLRTGQYDLAKASIEKMEALETHEVYRAEAKRLLAAALYQTGRANEAKDRLEEALQMSKKEPQALEVRIETLLDLTRFYHHENQTQKALQYLTECRNHCPVQNKLAVIKMDILEGMIAHTEGRFSDATKFYKNAFEAAKQTGTLSELARASNHLGNVQRDQGHYPQARHDYKQALSLWQRMGEIEGVAGAHNNLGNICMSLGEYEKARFHQESALDAGKKISNTRIIALAQSNLAILALEEGKNSEAVKFAEQALETLGKSGEWLRLLVLAVLGEGLLNSKKTAEAKRIFKEILEKCNDSSHPLAFAGALRGMGRLSLIFQNPQEALNYFEHAIALFKKLKRTQESARTAVLQAQVLNTQGEKIKAHEILEHALKEFEKIGAHKDKERILELLRK